MAPPTKRPKSLRSFPEDDEHDDEHIQLVKKKIKSSTLNSLPTHSKPDADNRATETVMEENQAIKKAYELQLEESFKLGNKNSKQVDFKGMENPSLPSASLERQLNRFNASAMSVRVDYQPHVCKDYYETGFCGYGDSCIFLHDRSEIKMSWQLEKEWDLKKTQEKNKAIAMEKRRLESEPIDETWKEICPICSSAFTEAVITTCGHYYCESCILKRIRDAKSTKKQCTCLVCKILIIPKFKPAQKDIDAIKDQALTKAEEDRRTLEREAHLDGGGVSEAEETYEDHV